ncbi:Os08g0259833 [Oryza sativa Japonica Group]|uniref:Os08g0259833 protein n=1 Tax=Oryza sativa subsp. japonica TaxID=39947 RepID=C7J5Y1_ORYSJ|nr:Os08g0259833 [Oryza sativa Japonica Group]|eukprot:NP_001175480.1 Os08g0259833 [Oryza sativa Japonica Group]
MMMAMLCWDNQKDVK